VAKKGQSEEEQILRALRQAEGGTRVADICREHGISEATYYIWKKTYSGLGLNELRICAGWSNMSPRKSNGASGSRRNNDSACCLTTSKFYKIRTATTVLSMTSQ